MPARPQLADTDKRQQALRRYHILDTAPEKDFDQFTRTIATVLDAPTALISLIDTERQWFKSCFGLDARETGLDVSFCIYAVHDEEMLIVEDATKDPRFKDNGLVTGDPGIRFYAGAPLVTPDDVYIGSLCIIDYEPRTFDAKARGVLSDMADLVVNQFELRSTEAQYRNLFDRNPRPMMIYDPETLHLLAANDAAVWQYGYSEEALTGMSVRDLHTKQNMPEALRNAGAERNASAGGGVYAGSGGMTRHLRKDGSSVVVEVEDQPIFYEGKSCRLLSAAEITERLRTEQRLRDEQAQSQGLLDHLPGAVFETDASGEVQHAGGSWEALTGRTTRAVEGTAFLHLVHPDDREALREAAEALRATGEGELCEEVRYLTEDSSGPRWGELRARLRHRSGGDATLVGTLVHRGERRSAGRPATGERDASEPSASEQTTSEQPTSEQSVAGPEANGEKDPFDEIFGLDGASEAESDGAAGGGDGQSEAAFEEWQNVMDASEDMLDGGEMPTRGPVTFDLAEELGALLETPRERAQAKGVVVHLDLPSGQTVTLPKEPVRRAFGHVVEHAIAHTDRGSITVGAEPGDAHTVVRVTDTGEGLSADQIDRILGEEDADAPDESGRRLRAARRVARQIGGDLEVESIPGHGTICSLRLPKESEATSA